MTAWHHCCSFNGRWTLCAWITIYLVLCLSQVCVMIHSGSRGLGHQVATGRVINYLWFFPFMQWLCQWHCTLFFQQQSVNGVRSVLLDTGTLLNEEPWQFAFCSVRCPNFSLCFVSMANSCLLWLLGVTTTYMRSFIAAYFDENWKCGSCMLSVGIMACRSYTHPSE